MCLLPIGFDETKEALTRRWEDIITRVGLVLNERQEVVWIERDASGILLTKVQSGQVHRSRTVVLAIDVSHSMGATDVAPSRLDRASAVAAGTTHTDYFYTRKCLDCRINLGHFLLRLNGALIIIEIPG